MSLWNEGISRLDDATHVDNRVRQTYHCQSLVRIRYHLMESVLTRDYPLMIGLAIVLYLMAGGVRDSEYVCIQRWEGGVLVAVFAAYQIWIFLDVAPAGAS